MLVLTRRISELLVIKTPGDDKIEITILAIKGNQVRIGIAAPMEYNIYREELEKDQ